MTGFTPGPWAVHKNEYGDMIVDREDVCVANVGRDQFGGPAVANFGHEQGPNVEADAHLIAAAPELLEALEQLLAITDDPLNDADECESVFPFARAVVAKARGESGQ